MQDAQLTIRLPQVLKEKLQGRATLEDRSVSDIVVRALSQASARWATAKGKA